MILLLKCQGATWTKAHKGRLTCTWDEDGGHGVGVVGGRVVQYLPQVLVLVPVKHAPHSGLVPANEPGSFNIS